MLKKVKYADRQDWYTIFFFIISQLHCTRTRNIPQGSTVFKVEKIHYTSTQIVFRTYHLGCKRCMTTKKNLRSLVLKVKIMCSWLPLDQGRPEWLGLSYTIISGKLGMYFFKCIYANDHFSFHPSYDPPEIIP